MADETEMPEEPVIPTLRLVRKVGAEAGAPKSEMDTIVDAYDALRSWAGAEVGRLTKRVESAEADLRYERDRNLEKVKEARQRAEAAIAELRSNDPNYTPLLDKYVADIQAYADRAEQAEARAAQAERDAHKRGFMLGLLKAKQVCDRSKFIAGQQCGADICAIDYDEVIAATVREG